MGVISLTPIQKGLCFGPIPTALMIADPAYLVGNMTCDTFPEIPITRVNLHNSMEMHRLIEWVPYLRSARCAKEQNLDLLRERNGEIFYRISRPVETGEELLIWFSREYCEQIGIPTAAAEEGSRITAGKDSVPYKCEHCSDKFKFPYPFICHNMFKCRANQNPKLLTSSQSLHNTLPLVSSSSSPSPPASTASTVARGNKRKAPHAVDQPYDFSMTAITNTPPEGSAFRKVSKPSPTLENSPPPLSAPLLPPVAIPPPSAASVAMRMMHPSNPLLGNMYFSPPSLGVHPFHLNNNNIISSTTNNNNSLYFPPSNAAYYPPSSYLQFTSMAAAAAAAEIAAAAAAVSTASTIAGRFPYHAGAVSTITTSTAASSPPTPSSRLPPPPVSLSQQPEIAPAAFTSLPKSGNPMVEKLLQSAITGESMVPNPLSSLSLTQNWCAKCNATFRMTSDLVYHMRTHHKRDRDVELTSNSLTTFPSDMMTGGIHAGSGGGGGSLKSKRIDHLQCDICGESFKERHHLTRHMTSHD